MFHRDLRRWKAERPSTTVTGTRRKQPRGTGNGTRSSGSLSSTGRRCSRVSPTSWCSASPDGDACADRSRTVRSSEPGRLQNGRAHWLAADGGPWTWGEARGRGPLRSHFMCRCAHRSCRPDLCAELRTPAFARSQRRHSTPTTPADPVRELRTGQCCPCWGQQGRPIRRRAGARRGGFRRTCHWSCRPPAVRRGRTGSQQPRPRAGLETGELACSGFAYSRPSPAGGSR